MAHFIDRYNDESKRLLRSLLVIAFWFIEYRNFTLEIHF
ncbi:hypothetical protein AOR13_1794 [Alteromonas stellipolaris LMG 21856]|nr:hypothetical protein AOR13_1794 [Alteromonas stellipolaris LMG 21856]